MPITVEYSPRADGGAEQKEMEKPSFRIGSHGNQQVASEASGVCPTPTAWSSLGLSQDCCGSTSFAILCKSLLIILIDASFQLSAVKRVNVLTNEVLLTFMKSLRLVVP